MFEAKNILINENHIVKQKEEANTKAKAVNKNANMILLDEFDKFNDFEEELNADDVKQSDFVMELENN